MIKRILQIVKSSFIPSNNITNLKISEFMHRYKNSENSVLLDVRTPNEVAYGRIDGTMNIDFLSNSFPAEISLLDKDKTYFVYCRSGQRSLKACKEMQRIGITKTINLEGGYIAFLEAKTT